MGGRQVQQNGEVVVTKHDMMMIALSDSGDSTSGSLCMNGNGAIQSNEGASGMKAQSAAYAAGLKAYNPDCRSIYAKICPGGTLENLLDELVAYFGEDMLAIENNPLLAPFLPVIKCSGNEFRNPNNNSKTVWIPQITEENIKVYARYVKIMKAFPRCIHGGFGSSECFCPTGSEAKKADYAEMVDNIVSNLEGIPLMFSEVAIRKHLIMKEGDPFHHDNMASNIEKKVQQVTATRIIAEFMRSIEIIGKQYEAKTYTTPYDGVVDMQNAQLEGVGPLPPADQEKELAERVKYVMNASVKLVPDHVFGEPMKIPQERLDPRSLSAEQWIAKDWKSVHANRVPVVRVTTLGTPIYDRADQTGHHLQRSHFNQ